LSSFVPKSNTINKVELKSKNNNNSGSSSDEDLPLSCLVGEKKKSIPKAKAVKNMPKAKAVKKEKVISPVKKTSSAKKRVVVESEVEAESEEESNELEKEKNRKPKVTQQRMNELFFLLKDNVISSTKRNYGHQTVLSKHQVKDSYIGVSGHVCGIVNDNRTFDNITTPSFSFIWFVSSGFQRIDKYDI